MSRIIDYLTGADLVSRNGSAESRTLTRGVVPETFPYFPSQTALPSVSEQTALQIADLFACVRVLADSVASLPSRVYRRTPGGRVPAGDDQRLVALLRHPSPGSTSADLFSTLMVHLAVFGNGFIAKYREEGTIVQLGCLDPQSVRVEQRGARIVYTLSRREGISEHGPEDVLRVMAMSQDGIRGLSPVKQAARILALDQALVERAWNWFGNASRPSGILSAEGEMQPGPDDLRATKDHAQEEWSAERFGKLAVFSGPVKFQPVDPAMRDQEFLAQRELVAREVARAMRVPAHMIDGDTAGRMTYANVAQQNRAFLDHSLRPWLVRIEQAFSNDTDLCPGGTYLSFDTDAFLRADADARATYYEKALAGGWLTVNEIREAEDRPPMTTTNEGTPE